NVRHLPCLCAGGPAREDAADAAGRGRDARRHREPAEAEQPPLLSARPLAGDGRPCRAFAGDPDLTCAVTGPSVQTVIPAKAEIYWSASQTVTGMGLGFCWANGFRSWRNEPSSFS